MRTREFNKLYPTYRGVLWAIAKKLTKHHPWLRQDCYQVGLICLKELQLDDVRNTKSYITQACKYAMIDELRQYAPHRYLSFFQAHYIGFRFHWDGHRMVAERHCREVPRVAPGWMATVNA